MKILHVQSILGKIKSHLTCPKCSQPVATKEMDMNFVSENMLAFSTKCTSCNAICDITAQVSVRPPQNQKVPPAVASFSIDLLKSEMANFKGNDVRNLFETIASQK